MNKSPNRHLSRYRKTFHLKLKDVAYLLEMDEANLSRFEARKITNSKALLSYNILFGLSSNKSSNQLFTINNDEIIHRCFKLIEIVEGLPKSYANRQRIDGINLLITKLSNTID